MVIRRAAWAWQCWSKRRLVVGSAGACAGPLRRELACHSPLCLRPASAICAGRQSALMRGDAISSLQSTFDFAAVGAIVKLS